MTRRRAGAVPRLGTQLAAGAAEPRGRCSRRGRAAAGGRCSSALLRVQDFETFECCSGCSSARRWPRASAASCWPRSTAAAAFSASAARRVDGGLPARARRRALLGLARVADAPGHAATEAADFAAAALARDPATSRAGRRAARDGHRRAGRLPSTPAHSAAKVLPGRVDHHERTPAKTRGGPTDGTANRSHSGGKRSMRLAHRISSARPPPQHRCRRRPAADGSRSTARGQRLELGATELRRGDRVDAIPAARRPRCSSRWRPRRRIYEQLAPADASCASPREATSGRVDDRAARPRAETSASDCRPPRRSTSQPASHWR